MPVNFPGGGPTITVEALLKQPRLIARNLTDLVSKRFVADQVFMRGTPDQVAGGAALYQRSESIYPTQNAEQVMPGSGYPRSAWTEAVYAAMVKKFGLEVPIKDETIRRNQLDVAARAQRKLANALTKFVDTQAMTLLLTDSAVQTFSAGGDWSTAATDIIYDIARARKLITDVDEGYDPDTMIVNPAQELDLLVDSDLRSALPREGGGNPAIVQGKAVPILGLRQILVTNQLTAGKVVICSGKVIGTIADEAPHGGEGYVGYSPGPAFATVYAKVYREDGTDETIVRGARFPAMWLAEPTSGVVITGA